MGGPAEIGQRHDPAHRVPDKSDRSGNLQRDEDISEVGGELLDR